MLGPFPGLRLVDASGSRPAVTRTLELLDEATDEAEEAARWYAQRSASAAVGFSDALAVAIWQIQEAPYRWPPHHHGTRRILLRRYPFGVIYRVDDARIVIIAVAHTSRRPGYWRERLDSALE
jgi:plasmid stabilization system protein ParE